MDREDMREMEEKCIQKHAPFCMAACPLHIDVRTIAVQIQEGKFDAAFKTFYKNAPFPRILSSICDQPCQQQCKRGEAGGAISISLLEKASVDYGKNSLKLFQSFRRIGKRVAVIGGGLSGLSAAVYLNEKGYDVEVFEQKGVLGGRIWAIPESILPRKLIQEDFDGLGHLDIRINFNTSIGIDIGFDEIYSSFDAVYIGIGENALAVGLDLECNEKGDMWIKPETLQTSKEHVFAGGRLRRQREKYSAVTSISDGKRVANSIDRYLKKFSLPQAGKKKAFMKQSSIRA